jgi:hypothetical protein
MKIKMFIAALALACTAAHADTPEDRCENLAVFAQGVAEVRDGGESLANVLQVVSERSGRGMVDAYKRVAVLVYRNGDLTPAEVRVGMLEGCLETVNAEKARRAGALKTSF